MRKDELLALAARVEAAAGADREMDAEIGEAMGWICEWVPWRDRPALVLTVVGLPTGREVPAFTASLDAAASLVPTKWDWEVYSDGRAMLWGDSPGELSGRITRTARAATPALALTAAALRAMAEGAGE